VTAAAQAAARHLRVYTIGFRYHRSGPAVCTPDQISGDAAIRGDGRDSAAVDSVVVAATSRSTRRR